MSEKSIYQNIMQSITGIPIPVFSNGKTVDSRYDPERDSLRLCQSISDKSKFIIVLGIASGVLIKTLLQNKKDIFILAVEKSEEDIWFLKQLEIVQQLEKEERVDFTFIDKLDADLTRLYIPSFYASLEVLEQRGWTEENKEFMPLIQDKIKNALAEISADYSVQSHFGKLWVHNLMSNLKQVSKLQGFEKYMANTSKTAVVLGAGPTLEEKIPLLKKDRQSFYIIATDTSLSVLCNNALTPDAVVSLDGQNVSLTHFIHSKKIELNSTLFLFDLTANPTAVRKVIQAGATPVFFQSGHPLSLYACKLFNLQIPALFSGAGTVTISALDYAIKSGFKKIIIYGADFSYVGGKAYAKGTYLDTLYNSKSSRSNTLEKQFDNLLFRTPLIELSKNRCTTTVLKAYQTSLESYLQTQGIRFEHTDNSYILNNSAANACDLLGNIFVTSDSKDLPCRLAEKLITECQNNPVPVIHKNLSNAQICLLPLISWLRNYDNKEKTDFNYYLKKAVHYFKKYWEE